MSFIDLHIHTDASDGVWSAETLFERSKEKGLSAIAITDHDSIENSRAGFALSQKYNINYINGIELTGLYNGLKNVHILGFGIDIDNLELRRLLKKYEELIHENDKINVAILKKKGFEIEYEDVTYYYNQKGKGFFPLFNAVRDKGYTNSVFDFYREIYLKHLEHIRYEKVDKIISIIKGSDGVPVLAHPSGYKNFYDDYEFDRKRLLEFINLGIEGIEAYSNYHTKDEIDFFSLFAKENGLLITGGSDCHGEILKRELGTPRVPFEIFENLMDAIREKRGSEKFSKLAFCR